MKHRAKVISLISGKGGVGKTSVSGSLAYVLSHLGYRVLLVDSDLATYGLSYFFIDEIKDETDHNLVHMLMQPSSLNQIVSHDKNTDEINLHLPRVNDHLFLLPAISKFSTPSDEDNDLGITNHKNISAVFNDLIRICKELVDFIILDTQAGAVPVTAASIAISDIVITVIEADPVGMWAVRNLERRLATSFSASTKSYYLANKLFFEEVAQYQTITDFLRAFTFLPPLPFDFEVRRAFSRRKIPISFDEPTAFLIANLRLLGDMLPETETKVNDLEKELFERATDPINKEIDKIENEIANVRQNLQSQSRSNRHRTVLFLSLSLGFILSIFFLIYNNYLSDLILNVILPIVLLLLSLLLIIYLYIFRLSMFKYSSDDIFLKELEDLLERRRSLDTLLFTKSDDLFFREQLRKTP